MPFMQIFDITSKKRVKEDDFFRVRKLLSFFALPQLHSQERSKSILRMNIVYIIITTISIMKLQQRPPGES